MTSRQNARIAGFTFLFYIAVGITQAFVGAGASTGATPAAKLQTMASHAAQIRANAMLGLVTAFTAIVLAAALYGLTRDEDHDLAVLALACRLGEGFLGSLPTLVSLTLLALATAHPADAEAAGLAPVAAALFSVRSTAILVGSLFFAVGSAVFAYLFFRGRLIPRWMAWLGVVSSLLLVACLPLQMIGALRGALTQLIWIPAAAFEIPLGIWLLVKGVDRT